MALNDIPLHLSEKSKVVFFCAIALLGAVAFSLVKSEAILALYMFIPTFSTLILLFLLTRDGMKKETWKEIGIRLRWKYLLPAFLIPATVLSFSYLLTYIINPDFYIGTPSHTPLHAFHLILFITGISIIQTLSFSLGEELGWRGYLLPKIIALTGSRLKSHILIGFIWAIWHFPLIFIAKAYNTGGNTAYTTLLFVTGVVILSIIIGELKLRSKSIWPASLFHSVHNSVWGVFSPLFISGAPVVYLSGESGIVTLLLYAMTAVIIIVFSKEGVKLDHALLSNG